MDVNGISVAKALEIENSSVVRGYVAPVTGHLMLVTKGGTEIDAGLVVGNPDMSDFVKTADFDGLDGLRVQKGDDSWENVGDFKRVGCTFKAFPSPPTPIAPSADALSGVTDFAASAPEHFTTSGSKVVVHSPGIYALRSADAVANYGIVSSTAEIKGIFDIDVIRNGSNVYENTVLVGAWGAGIAISSINFNTIQRLDSNDEIQIRVRNRDYPEDLNVVMSILVDKIGPY